MMVIQIEEANDETSNMRWLFSILTPLKKYRGRAMRRASEMTSAEKYHQHPALLEEMTWVGLTDELRARDILFHSTGESETKVQLLDEYGNPHYTECDRGRIRRAPKLNVRIRDSDYCGYHAHAGGPVSRSSQRTVTESKRTIAQM